MVFVNTFLYKDINNINKVRGGVITNGA